MSSGYAQTYLDERKVMSFYTHARGFIARERLYVAFDYSATLFAEIAPPVALLSLEDVIEDICPLNHPATSKIWVGGCALIRGKLVGGDLDWLLAGAGGLLRTTQIASRRKSLGKGLHEHSLFIQHAYRRAAVLPTCNLAANP